MITVALLLQQLVNGISKGSIYALIALGYTMVYGIIELINFAHGDIFMLGSFIAISVVGLFGINNKVPELNNPLGVIGVLLVAFLVTMLLTGTLGVVIERVAYRPLWNAPKLASLISAIGVSYILQNVGLDWRGPNQISFPPIIPGESLRFTVGGGLVIIRPIAIVLLIVSITLMVLLTLFVQRTKLGKAMRATAMDRETAQLMGINANNTIALTFFIGGALAGAGAILYGMSIQIVQFNVGFQTGLRAFTAAVLGGIGNIPGAVLGGFIIGLVEAYSDTFLETRWTQAVVFFVLIGILVFRPSGLLGQHVTEKV